MLREMNDRKETRKNAGLFFAAHTFALTRRKAAFANASSTDRMGDQIGWGVIAALMLYMAMRGPKGPFLEAVVAVVRALAGSARRA